MLPSDSIQPSVFADGMRRKLVGNISALAKSGKLEQLGGHTIAGATLEATAAPPATPASSASSAATTAASAASDVATTSVSGGAAVSSAASAASSASAFDMKAYERLKARRSRLKKAYEKALASYWTPGRMNSTIPYPEPFRKKHNATERSADEHNVTGTTSQSTAPQDRQGTQEERRKETADMTTGEAAERRRQAKKAAEAKADVWLYAMKKAEEVAAVKKAEDGEAAATEVPIEAPIVREPY